MALPASKDLSFNGIHCSMSIKSFPSRVVVVRISGTDIGEFGEEPMLELKKCLLEMDPIHLFIDARDVRGASIEVSGEWAAWLRNHKAHLQRISMLTGSRFIEVTAEFVRRFADLEGIMRIYTEPAAFDMALARSV